MMPPRPRFIPPLGAPALSERERVLAQWRGFNLRPLEKVKERPARPAGDFLGKIVTDLRIDSRRHEAEIVQVWNQSLDPAVIAHAQPVGLRNGTLFVNVDNSAWLSEIVRYRSREILQRLQHSFGREMIKKISFRIG